MTTIFPVDEPGGAIPGTAVSFCSHDEEDSRVSASGKVAVRMGGRAGLGAVQRLGRAGAQGRSRDALVAEGGA